MAPRPIHMLSSSVAGSTIRGGLPPDAVLPINESSALDPRDGISPPFGLSPVATEETSPTDQLFKYRIVGAFSSTSSSNIWEYLSAESIFSDSVMKE